MTGSSVTHVVVAAGGLGTRAACWAQYLPKEFYPVAGRPGIVHLLEEISALSPADVVIVYHPYYEQFIAWARKVLSPGSHARYAHAAGRPIGTSVPAGLTLGFIPQRGTYADLTSVLNGSDHLNSQGDLYVVFADNLYRSQGPLLALRDAIPGQVAVLARRYRPELASTRGVIATTRTPTRPVMIELAEKPSPRAARAMERRYGYGNLFLLEGRMRLTADFIDFARDQNPSASAEPKLALALAAYATSRPVHIIETSEDVTDLGTLPRQLTFTSEIAS